ncbi:MAG: PilZ domain-containing protein, partial [Candidatus Eremiobacterota bacterium]
GLMSLFQGRGGRTPEERRRLIRLKCNYDVTAIVGDRSMPARVIDVGLYGMRLEMRDRLRAGASVYVHHPKPSHRFDNEHVLCEVRWCRRRPKSDRLEIGVQYADTPGNMRRSWVKFLLKELGFDERAIYTRRKAIRAPSSISAEMRDEKGDTIPGMVVNVGVGGALFQSQNAFGPGTNIRMKIGPYRRFKPLELTGTIISTRKQDETDGYLTSVRFGATTPGQVRLLGDYVIDLLKSAAD